MKYTSIENMMALRDIRRQRGFSLENLSDDLEISKSELSRMEQGKRKMPEDMFSAALKSLDIQWDQNIVVDLEKKIHKMITFLYEMDLEKASSIMNTLIEERKRHRYSDQYFWWLAIDYIDAIVFYDDENLDRGLAALEKSIFNCLDIYPSDMQILLKDLRSLRMDQGKITEQCLNINLLKQTSAAWTLSMYHEFQRVCKNGSLYEALELYCRIEEKLKSARNFKRILAIDILKCEILTRIGEYGPAESLLLSTLAKVEEIGYLDLKKRITESLIWNAIKAGKAESALKYMKEAAASYPDQLDNSNLLYAPLCLLAESRIDEAKLTLEWMRLNLHPNALGKKILLMSSDLINERSKMFIRNADKCIKEALREDQIESAKFVLDIQIRFYEKKGDLESAYKKVLEKSNVKSIAHSYP